MANMNECIFCRIAAGEIPSHKVYEDADTFAFLDIRPVNRGHTLVIPKKHATDIFEIDDETWSAVTRTVRTIAHAQEKAFRPEGVNVIMNNRPGAGQVVFHAHVHVIPRFPNDGHEHWHGTPYAEGEAPEIAQQLNKALS